MCYDIRYDRTDVKILLLGVFLHTVLSFKWFNLRNKLNSGTTMFSTLLKYQKASLFTIAFLQLMFGLIHAGDLSGRADQWNGSKFA